MEQRLHPRFASNLRVRIQIGDVPLLTTTTDNISVDGLFLRLTHPLLTPAEVIKVELEVPANRSPWHSRAIVAHASHSGTGVLLLNPLPAILTITKSAATGARP